MRFRTPCLQRLQSALPQPRDCAKVEVGATVEIGKWYHGTMKILRGWRKSTTGVFEFWTAETNTAQNSESRSLQTPGARTVGERRMIQFMLGAARRNCWKSPAGDLTLTDYLSVVSARLFLALHYWKGCGYLELCMCKQSNICRLVSILKKRQYTNISFRSPKQAEHLLC
jgi:hypothetical protein